MNNISILQEMLKYIDAHIKEKMSVEILAKRAGFSPYYFCRLFQSIVGTSIMDYVRNRRLAYAAQELSSKQSLLDIANDYGFETHSGFSKAFRRFFGSPPEVFRAYASFKVPEIQDITKSYQFESDKIIEPKVMAKTKAFKIAGYEIKVDPNSNEIFQQVNKFYNECKTDGQLDKLHNDPLLKPHVEYAVLFFNNSNYSESSFVFGLEIKSKKKIPPLCEAKVKYPVYTIPDLYCAVFSRATGETEEIAITIKDTWQYIFSEWLPNSGYEFDNNGIAFEIYTENSAFCNIYIPIVNKQL